MLDLLFTLPHSLVSLCNTSIADTSRIANKSIALHLHLQRCARSALLRHHVRLQDPTDSVSEPLHKHEMYSSSDTDESVSSKDGDSASDDEEQCWCTRCTHYTLTTHRRARHSQLENLPEAHFQTATVAANDPQQVRSDRPLTDEQLTQVTNAVAEAAAAVEGQELASGWLLV